MYYLYTIVNTQKPIGCKIFSIRFNFSQWSTIQIWGWEKEVLCSTSKLFDIFCFVSHSNFELENNQSSSNEGVYIDCSFLLDSSSLLSQLLMKIFFVILFATFSIVQNNYYKAYPTYFATRLFHSFKCSFSSSNNFPKCRNRQCMFLKLFFLVELDT
jgi:hypothetical protein